MAPSRSRIDVRTIARAWQATSSDSCCRCCEHTLNSPPESVLRRQLALYLERKVKPRRADDATRLTLSALSQLIDWRRVLTVVKPDKLVRWHRTGFRLFWRWKSLPRGAGRYDCQVRVLDPSGQKAAFWRAPIVVIP